MHFSFSGSGCLTQSSLAVVVLSFCPPSAVAAQPLYDDVDVGEDDERRGQDGAVVEGHDQLISLELPHLVRDGLHLEKGIAVEEYDPSQCWKCQLSPTDISFVYHQEPITKFS